MLVSTSTVSYFHPLLVEDDKLGKDIIFKWMETTSYREELGGVCRSMSIQDGFVIFFIPNIIQTYLRIWYRVTIPTNGMKRCLRHQPKIRVVCKDRLVGHSKEARLASLYGSLLGYPWYLGSLGYFTPI